MATPKTLTRSVIGKTVRGNQYGVPQHTVEEVVRAWLIQQPLFCPLSAAAEWSYEWHNSELLVTHARIITTITHTPVEAGEAPQEAAV